MKIEHCLYILEVAQAGSVRKAAEKLFITQQGLSHAIKSVESELGVKIFSRSENSLTVTASGSAILEHFRRMVDSYQDLLADISQQNGDVGTITIYYSTGTGTLLAPTIVKRLTKRYPRLKIQMFIRSTPEIRHLELDENTVCIFSEPDKVIDKIIGEGKGSVKFHKMVTVPIQCVTSSSSPFAGRKSIEPEDLRVLPMAVFDHEMALLDDVLGNHEEANMVFLGMDHSLFKDVVCNTSSVGFTTAVIERFFKRSNVTLIPFSPGLSLCYGCLTKTGALSPVVEECLDMIREELERCVQDN